MAYLEHILLVDHHSVGLAEKLFHHGVDVLEFIRVMEAVDELAHHARACHAGTNDRAGSHKSKVIITFELLQQPAH